MMKQGLNIRLGQSLTMTPQLQQAIRLLQLSNMELEQEIQEMLETNPLLEVASDQVEPVEENSSKENSQTEDNKETSTVESDIPNDMDIDANWDDVYADHTSPSNSSSENSATTVLEKTCSDSDTLQSHLRWQIELSQLSASDKVIAESIIEAIDDKGYLRTSTTSLYELLKEDLLLEELNEIESILAYIQHLDPVGVGSRHLGECLAIQLQVLYPDHNVAPRAAKLIKTHPEYLEIKKHSELKKQLKISPKQFSELIQLIKTLNPYPGSGFDSSASEYITPDVYVKKINGQWHVSLSPSSSTSLQVNDFYTDLLISKGSSEDKKYLKKNLQDANWFIKSVESRNHTIIKVTQLIVEHQKAFLQYGNQAMKPMVLRNIAEKLDMHESSISRATTNKYIHTPQGVFELKYFFSSQVSTDSGGSCSSTAIQSMIKKMIDDEDLKKPLSDNKLTVLLKEQGIKVARRTVAKYREALNIPSSHERKIMA